MPKFEHTYTLSFEIVSAREDGLDLSGLDLRNALLARLDDLSDNDMLTACELFDTTELEDDAETEDDNEENDNEMAEI
jgi:hypothetical protein